MKKLVLISTLIASFVGLSAFGQGYFQFSSGKSQVYDGFSTGVAHTATDVNVAFLWAASGDLPSVDSIMASVPTTTTSASSTYSPASAWTAILNDPNFVLAVNNNTATMAIVGTLATGAISYNTGTAFPVTGTAVNGNYAVFMIGWNNAYATPALAAAAGSSVGWSAPFAYTAAALTGSPQTMIGATPNFGVAGITVPEPTTMALAGLGGLAVLMFRRRK